MMTILLNKHYSGHRKVIGEDGDLENYECGQWWGLRAAGKDGDSSTNRAGRKQVQLINQLINQSQCLPSRATSRSNSWLVKRDARSDNEIRIRKSSVMVLISSLLAGCSKHGIQQMWSLNALLPTVESLRFGTSSNGSGFLDKLSCGFDVPLEMTINQVCFSNWEYCCSCCWTKTGNLLPVSASLGEETTFRTICNYIHMPAQMKNIIPNLRVRVTRACSKLGKPIF